MIKYTNVKQISVDDWDDLVTETYDRTYNFQQQDGCKERQTCRITVPVKNPQDYKRDTVPEFVNHEEMGVSFEAWLKRDPDQKLSDSQYQHDWALAMWWDRNFYPHVDMIINDLHSKGLLEAGEYEIDIDW